MYSLRTRGRRGTNRFPTLAAESDGLEQAPELAGRVRVAGRRRHHPGQFLRLEKPSQRECGGPYGQNRSDAGDYHP